MSLLDFNAFNGAFTQDKGKLGWASLSGVQPVLSGSIAAFETGSTIKGFGGATRPNDPSHPDGADVGYAGIFELSGLSPDVTYTWTISQAGTTPVSGTVRTLPDENGGNVRLLMSTCDQPNHHMIDDPFKVVRSEILSSDTPVYAYIHIDDVSYFDGHNTVDPDSGAFVGNFQHGDGDEYVLACQYLFYMGLLPNNIYSEIETVSELFNPYIREDRLWVYRNVARYVQWGDHEIAGDFGRGVSNAAQTSFGRNPGLLVPATDCFKGFLGACLPDFLGDDTQLPPAVSQGTGTAWHISVPGKFTMTAPDCNTFAQPYQASDVGDSTTYGRYGTTGTYGTRSGEATNPQRTDPTVLPWDGGKIYQPFDFIEEGGLTYSSMQKDNENHQPTGVSDEWWYQQESQGALSDQFPGMIWPTQLYGDTMLKATIDKHVELDNPFNFICIATGISKLNEPWADRFPDEFDAAMWGGIGGTEGMLKHSILNGGSGQLTFLKGDTHSREINKYVGDASVDPVEMRPIALGGAQGQVVWEMNPATINASLNGEALGSLYQNGERVYEFSGGTGEGNASTVFASMMSYDIGSTEQTAQMIDTSDGAILWEGYQYSSDANNDWRETKKEESPVAILGYRRGLGEGLDADRVTFGVDNKFTIINTPENSGENGLQLDMLDKEIYIISAHFVFASTSPTPAKVAFSLWPATQGFSPSQWRPLDTPPNAPVWRSPEFDGGAQNERIEVNLDVGEWTSGIDTGGLNPYILAYENADDNSSPFVYRTDFGFPASFPIQPKTAQLNPASGTPTVWQSGGTYEIIGWIEYNFTGKVNDGGGANRKAFRAGIQGDNVSPNLKTKGARAGKGSGGKHRSPHI